MTAIARAQWLADARALLDLIEAENLPVHLLSGVEITFHPCVGGGDDADRMAAVDALADRLGTPVTTPDMPGSHYETAIRCGSAGYRMVSVLRDDRERYDAIRRLGEAALAEREQVDTTLREVAETVTAC